MKIGEIQKLKMLYGIKEGNKSFKIFMKSETEYFIVKKHYILGIFQIKKMLKFESKEEAVDYIINNTNKFHHIDI